MDEVLNDLADDHEGQGPPLLLREARHRGRDLLKVVPYVLGLDDDDARRGGGVIIDGDSGGAANFERLALSRLLVG